MKCNKTDKFCIKYFVLYCCAILLSKYICGIACYCFTNIAYIALIAHIGKSFQFRHILHTFAHNIGTTQFAVVIPVANVSLSLSATVTVQAGQGCNDNGPVCQWPGESRSCRAGGACVTMAWRNVFVFPNVFHLFSTKYSFFPDPISFSPHYISKFRVCHVP